MADKHPRMLREEKTITVMMGIYCRGQHGTSGTLCPDCAQLLDYAGARLDRCIFQEKKPTCGNCPVHCYKPAMREKVKEVMRYAGPRMLTRHPILAFFHFLYGFRKVQHPRQKNTQE